MDGNIKVTYVDHMGSDFRIVNAARVSNAKDNEESPDEGFINYILKTYGEKLTSRDIKLLRYLAKNKHTSPFEHCTMTAIVQVPLFIRSQIHRHRTFSYNEISRRYTSDGIAFYWPNFLPVQDTVNKQVSGDKHPLSEAWLVRYKSIVNSLESIYKESISGNISREYARMILPQNLMTRFYMSGNLLNWIKFIKLRISQHAQYEARLVGNQALNILKQKFPISTTCLMYWMQ